MMAGMLDVLQKEALDAQIHVEYLDAKRYPPETFGPILTETLIRKTSRLKPKVIVVSDDAAFDLMLSLRNDLFPGVPLVFCGVNNFKDERLAGQMEVTGVVEDFDIKSTIDVILTLHKQATHLAVISDSTDTGTINLKRFRQVAPVFADRLKFLELYDLSTEELFGKLAKLPPDTIILNLSFFRDRLGQTYSTRDGNKLIAAHAGCAIYSCWDYFLVGDVLGGYVTSGRQQGEEAATMVAAILKGIRANNIPIIRTSPNAYMFDYNVMKRFGIKESALPKGSVIINRQVSLWEQYWGWLLGIVAIAGLQTFLILALFTRGKRLRTANAALRTSEKRIRTIGDNLQGAQLYQLRVAPDGNAMFTYVSSKVEDLHECKPEDVLKDASLLFKRVHPADADEWQKLANTSLRELTTYNHTVRIVRKSGEIRWHQMISKPKKLDDGSVLFDGVELDVTESKQAEEALRESLARYDELAANVPVGVYVLWLRANGHVEFEYLSDRWCEIHQLKREDVLCDVSRVDNLVHPDDQDEFVLRNQESFRNPIPFTWEGRFLIGDGKFRWLRIESTPIVCDNGDIRWFGVTSDITERKQVEEQLQKSEEQFRNLYDDAPVGYFEYDLQGNITRVNDRYIKMLGYAAEELIGQPCWKFIVDEFAREQILEKLRGVRPPAVGLERTYHRKDGTTSPVLFEDRVLTDEDGTITGIRTAIQDITQFKQSEAEQEKLREQLNQARKMESVGRLAGGVAHDFNNMLGVILGHTEMALDELDPSAPLYANLHAVQQAAERSADLTRQLLAFARKQTIAPKVINLNTTVEGMLKMLHRLIGEDIDLLWKPGGNLAPVKADPSQIDQILVNLCINARDAIAGVGKITIETDTVSFGEAYCAVHAGFVPGEYVLLAVGDNGCGMDQEIISHLFEPFFTTKEQGKGTGLGLASVYGAVKQNNGFINVYSEPGQGTTFKIYLPQHQASTPRHADKTTAKPIAEAEHETILLVEDEPAILDMATMMLERLGYVVIAAINSGRGYPLGP